MGNKDKWKEELEHSKTEKTNPPSVPRIPYQDRPEIPQSDREKQGGNFPGENQ